MQGETSSAAKSVIVQNTGQQAHSTIDDTLNVSLPQHSKASAPNTVAETNCNSIHEQTLTDLDYIICQAASGGNSLGQTVQNHSGLDQLQQVLESCLGNLDMTLQSTVFNISINAEQEESSKIKLELGTLE